MSAAFEALKAEVTRNKTVDDSVIALINRLAALKEDPVALAALVTELKTSSDAVVEAVSANTPAEEPPPA